MKVSIGFSASQDWIGKVIRWFTQSSVNHTFLLLDDLIPGVPMVMQASRGGFQLVTYERFCKGATIVKVVQPTQDISDGVTQALQWLGESYDDVGLVGMMFVEIGRRFKRNWRNWLHSSDSMWCSEAVAYVLQAAKYPGADKLDPTTLAPGDLLSFMSTSSV